MNAHAVCRAGVVTVSCNMPAAVNDQAAFSELRGKPFRHDCTCKSGSNNQIIESLHGGLFLCLSPLISLNFAIAGKNERSAGL
jgi:hypothetical protein